MRTLIAPSILLATLTLATALAQQFDPEQFWQEQTDLPLDPIILQRGDDPDILWYSLVYTSETYNNQPMRIFAWYAQPKTTQKIPAVLSIHGGGGSADLPRAQAFAKAGYACLAFDWNTFNDPQQNWQTGDPLPSHPFTTYGTLRYPDWARQFVAPEQDDWKRPVIYRAIMAARRGLTYLSQQPQIDPQKIAAEGHSWGGFIVQLLAGIDTRPKAIVSSAAILGWRTRYQQKIEGHLQSLTPEEFEQWEKRYDAALYAQNITAPILIRCAAADFFGSIDTLPSYWDKIKSPKRLQLLPAGNHTFGDVQTRLHWFNHHLLGAPGFPQTPTITHRPPAPAKNATDLPVAITVDGPAPITNVTLAYTTSNQQWNRRNWAQIPLQNKKNTWTATARCPHAGGPIRIFASAIDANGRIVSSPITIVPLPPQKLAQAQMPGCTQAATVHIKKTTTPPTTADKTWKPSSPIQPIANGPEVLGEQQCRLDTLWDNQALYLKIHVTDRTPWLTAPPQTLWHQADSIQLRLRTDEKLDDNKITPAEQNILHLGWYPGPDRQIITDAVRGRDFKGIINDTSPVKTSIILEKEKGAQGAYTLIAQIPWALIDPTFTPQPGRSLKFALLVNYADILTTERTATIDFNRASEFSNPASWGLATLVE
ncbi:MAG TPA: alpha/beta fold hydrolase [Planctomycetota bacterium]|nr:alpha/beta fold hydrolase [Planctomycetota bacterium]